MRFIGLSGSDKQAASIVPKPGMKQLSAATNEGITLSSPTDENLYANTGTAPSQQPS